MPSLPDRAGKLARGAQRTFRDRVGKLVVRAPGTPARLARLALADSFPDVVGGKVVLITGASSGIGRAAAVRIAGAGGRALLVARTEGKLRELQSEIESEGGLADVLPCDLTDLDAIDEMAAEALKRHGQVDILVNNAGKSIRRSLALSYDRMHDFQRTMQLNYFGAVKLILSLIPQMRERGSGHVINISTAGVQTHVPRFSAYLASKAALDAFSDSIAGEVRGDGVRITSIMMPLVRTPMIAPTDIYKGVPALTPEEAAELIAEAIVTSPRRLGSVMGTAAEMAHAVTPASTDVVLNTAYQLFPDSEAARGDSDARQELSGPAKLFARVFRGQHW